MFAPSFCLPLPASPALYGAKRWSCPPGQWVMWVERDGTLQSCDRSNYWSSELDCRMYHDIHYLPSSTTIYYSWCKRQATPGINFWGFTKRSSLDLAGHADSATHSTRCCKASLALTFPGWWPSHLFWGSTWTVFWRKTQSLISNGILVEVW